MSALDASKSSTTSNTKEPTLEPVWLWGEGSEAFLPKLRITAIEPIFVDRYLFVKVHTDAGITGLGESGTWGFLEASAQVMETYKLYLIGQDPLRIEYHWQSSTSACQSTSCSAAPPAIRRASTTTSSARRARNWCGAASTPFTNDPREEPYFKTHAAKIGDAIETVSQYRAAVGDAVDLCIEIHRRLTPAEAVVLARGIEPYHPFFYEDPILLDNCDAMALVAEQIHIPIACTRSSSSRCC